MLSSFVMVGEGSPLTNRSKPTAKKKLKSPIRKDNTGDRRRVPVTGTDFAKGIPIIDVHRFSSVTEANITELRSALSKWGCFQVVNHGIESSVLEGVRRIGRDFARLPAAEKQKYASSAGGGGGGGGGHSTDVLVVENQFPNNLGLRVVPEDRQNPKYWPQNPQFFKKVMMDYSGELKRVEEEILKLIARSLKLSDEKIFALKTGVMYVQFNYYPPSPNPERARSLREHADASVITFLLQDDNLGGIQVLRDGKWYDIPIPPHALFVFAGDQLEIMSNGIFKSRVHRAVRVSSATEGCTLAVFSSPDAGEEVGPLNELVRGGRQRMYKKVTNYMGFYYPYFCKGERAIDALRI